MATNAPETRADDESREPRGCGCCWHLMHSTVVRTMSSHARELGFVVAVLFTLYAAFHTSPLRTKKAPLPKPFFSRNSLVDDYFSGNILKAFERIPDSDLTFVMYYAPWDAASMAVRTDFEKLAKYHHHQIYFAAINCWWPEGECRRRFSKIRSFPVLIAYHSSGKGIQFHGRPSFPQLVHFLDNLIDPLTAIHSRKDLLRLLVKHNAVVLGFFGFHVSPQPPGYSSFYIAALKALEKDLDRLVGFAVVSNAKEALKFGIKSNGTIHLYLWNSTQSFIHDGPLTSKAILDWIFIKKVQVVRWLSPPGTKSALLSSILESSATIVMLTPKFVTSSLAASPFYYMFKEVALDYFNCNGSSQTEGIIAATRREFVEARIDEQYFHERCSNVEDVNWESLHPDRCCQSVAVENVEGIATFNGSVCEVCEVSDLGIDGVSSCDGSSNQKIPLYHHKAASHLPQTGCSSAMFHFGRYSVCCRSTVAAHHLDGGNPNLPNSDTAQYRCMLLHDGFVASTVNAPVVKQHGRKLAGFPSLGCRTNRTLSFVVMDSLEYYPFFDKLGIDVLATASKTAVAIIQAEQESHFVLNEQVTSESLRKFIVSYSNGVLRRHNRSTKIDLYVPNVIANENLAIVQEITGDNFNNVVMDDNRDVVLLIYAPWCTFCSGIAHVYLMAAQYFQTVTEVVRFVRINGDANDLPWEFNVQKYPTLVFFPARRKADSVDFPANVPITTTNLIHFVLLHTSQEVKLLTASSVCTEQCIAQNRRLALRTIGDLLQRFRASDSRLRDVRDFLSRECRDGQPVDLQRMSNYVEYARHLVHEMCDLRTQLNRAKTLHMALSTVPGDRFTVDQLRTIVGCHEEFASYHLLEVCEDGLNSLNAKLKVCLDRFEPSYNQR